MPDSRKGGGTILLTGATGYVGSRLLESLKGAGYRLRCLARRPERLPAAVSAGTEVVKGDVLDASSLRKAFLGTDRAFYLVHSMGGEGEFEERDRRAATIFGTEARRAGVGRIIYLGGLAGGRDLSSHLESRLEVGRILAKSGVPLTEFRASIIIGAGSLSFEMIRALVEKLPVMVTPLWVRTRAQPIAIDDVVAYLGAALDIDEDGKNAVFEIGGADRVSYLEIMKEYARQRRLRRLMIPVPVLTPWLSSLWLGLVTPVFAHVGRKLIEGVRNETIVRDGRALNVFSVRPLTIAESIRRALEHEDLRFSETVWTEVLKGDEPTRPWCGRWIGSRIVDSRTVRVAVPPSAAFKPIEGIGGSRGWYCADRLWRLRGRIDSLLGGPGMRRGRRDDDRLAVGDVVDFWRVEAVEPDRMLRLAAEMRLPGRAWLQFDVAGNDSSSLIRQTAVFDPRGLCGRLYWYALAPIHQRVFAGMLKAIAKRAH